MIAFLTREVSYTTHQLSKGAGICGLAWCVASIVAAYLHYPVAVL